MGQKRRNNRVIVRFIAFVLAIFVFAIINNSSAFAEAIVTSGVFTDDATNIRWEWELTNDAEDTDEPQKVAIKFYDKPENLTTVTVPSLSTVIGKVPDANSTLNTYYLTNANVISQNENYPDLTRREATADTTKLDMTNTSKIQILGVKPIIDPSVETELVFGTNMVIGDGTISKMIRASVCSDMRLSWNDKYSCWESDTKTFPVPGAASMTEEELANYTPTIADTGCLLYASNTITSLNYDSTRCYAWNLNLADNKVGAFSGYKLKLTNFNASNFNYVGWNAFAFTEIAGQTITITGTTFAGGDIFRGSNIKKAVIETETIGAGIFRDCAKLTEVSFADTVTRITDDAFAGTGLTSFDFSTTNIKTIGPRAFDGAKLTSIKLDGVNRIEYMAFANNQIKDLTLPKSINYLQSSLFKNNANMEKVTIAYDTLTSGTTLPMFVVLDDRWCGSDADPSPSCSIREVNIIAPYAEDEEVSSTHVAYKDYKWNYNAYDQHYMPECPQYYNGGACNGNAAAGNDYGQTQYGAWVHNYYTMSDSYSEKQNYRGSGSDFEDTYAHVDTYKNVLAPIYFHNMPNLHKVTLSEGYEFIGSMAFYFYSGSYSGAGGALFEGSGANAGYALNLPESLRGVGNGAFFGKFQDSIDFTIPKNIEFIGINAFMNTFFYDKDVDFPNLVALGDHSFEKTRVKNIHLYDKLQYMGAQVFSDCLFINDITFDLDVFNPDIYIAWALPHRHGSSWYDGQFHLTTEFGPRYPYSFSNEQITRYGLNVKKRDWASNLWPLMFGEITFTGKNISQLPNGYHNCYYARTGYGYSNGFTRILDSTCPGGFYGTDIYNTFFGHLNAKKIDIGETGWKVLSPRMFVNTYAGEVVLPKGLEVIPGDSFSDTVIDKELILPDTLKVVGDAAFDNGQMSSSINRWDSATQSYKLDADYASTHTVKITKLPKSLEYIGNDAFWGNYNLTADLDSPNLKHVGWHAFWGTRLRDVYLPPSMKELHGAAFANIPTLRDITIDFDFGALPPNYVSWDPNDFPQSARDYAGANLFHYITMSCSAAGMADFKSYPVTGFYSMFNQGVYSDDHDRNNYQIITAYGQKKSHTHFGKVTFTENAKSDIYMFYSDGSTGSFNGTGYFAGMEFDELDMSAAGFKQMVQFPFAFEETKIGKLSLPEGLETINYGTFMNAEIGSSFTVPNTVKMINNNAFMWTKIDGDVTIEGAETMNSNAFYQSKITGTVTLPESLKTLTWADFMESELGGLVLNEGLETIGDAAFYQAKIGGEFEFPSTLKSVGTSAFMRSDINVKNSFKEGLETLKQAAFYDTDFTDDLVIPSTVKSIGWSAISTGDADVHYDTVTIKPDLTVANSSNQRVHQLLWNTSIDKLIIDSNSLVAMDMGVEGPISDYDNGEEFWNMDIKEVVINNLPKITYAAFNKCDKLEIVDMSKNTKIREIDDQAFMNDEKLRTVKFSPNISEEEIIIGDRAFANTGFRTIGKAGSDFNLYAAHFNAAAGGAFSKMKVLKSVDVPETFSYARIPEKTFYDSSELEEASIAYRVKLIDNAAFANDNKLARIFIWGNTTILDENLPGYDAPISGLGADGDGEEGIGPTIPEGTDIYAYSSWNAEPYAGSNARDGFDGEFYPLDEVLYITTNKTHVKVNDNETDFDKSGMIVYGLRRDGVVLESDSWGDFNNNVYRRSEKDLNFAKMIPAVMEDPAFATVWDTPVPVNELSYENENFKDIDFELVDDEDGVAGVKRINIIYTDAYTGGEPDTDVLPIGDNIPVLPRTVDDIVKAVSVFGILALVGAATLVVSRRAFHRR